MCVRAYVDHVDLIIVKVALKAKMCGHPWFTVMRNTRKALIFADEKLSSFSLERFL